VRIREVDASTAPDDELLALHTLEEACAPPGEPFRPPQLSLGYYRHSPAKIRRHFFAEEDDALVGAATLSVFGPAFVYADLAVLPSARRQGIGTALLEEVRAAVLEIGAELVLRSPLERGRRSIRGEGRRARRPARHTRDARPASRGAARTQRAQGLASPDLGRCCA